MQSRFVRVMTIQGFSVLFCLVRAVHKFDSNLVINKTPNNGDQGQEGDTVIEKTHVFDGIYMFSPGHRREC
jgi:hypothetical protein